MAADGNAHELDQARKLFMRYHGLRFHMWHDGILQTYEGYDVPPHLESAWLRELTDARLGSLSESQDWRALDFFLSHRDARHLAAALVAPPAGKLLDRTIYLECLARYMDLCSTAETTTADSQAALRVVIDDGRRIRRWPRSERTRARLESAITGLESHLV